jgi:hypothetical protein
MVSANTLDGCARIFRPRRSLWHVDRPLGVPEMPETVIEVIDDLHAIFLLEYLVEVVPNLAIQDRVSLLVAADQLADKEHPHLREQRRRGAAWVAKSNVSGLHGIHDVDLFGQQRAAMVGDIQFSLCSVG